MSTQTETGIDTGLFIGGAFVEAEGGRTFENRDPWSGDVVSDVASASGADASGRSRLPPRPSPSGPARRRPCGRASS